MPTNEELTKRVDLCPASLQAIIEDFRSVTPRERLEFLLEYSLDLPEMPQDVQEDRDSLEQVHECQTPVFLHTEYENGRVRFLFDVPQESPTVRGYAAILQQGFRDSVPNQVLTAPEDIYILLGLQEAISPLRLRGLHALMVYMKRQVKRLV
jgi:cysteine desulfuration protein SufE